MAESKQTDRIEDLVERTDERHEKSANYTAEKSEPAQKRAKAHVRAGNAADISITGLGSKTLNTGLGTVKGFLRGVGIGIVFGLPAALFVPLWAPTIGAAWATYMSVAVVISTIKGAHSGYYKAKNNYSAHKGAKVGDKVAREGNALAPKVKDKVVHTAIGETMNHEDRPKADEYDAEFLKETAEREMSHLDKAKQRNIKKAIGAEEAVVTRY